MQILRCREKKKDVGVRAVKVIQIYERLRADNRFTSRKARFVILGCNNTFF